jgi:hypothetical protein
MAKPVRPAGRADEQDEAERIGQIDVAELACRGEGELRVRGLEGALELGVSVALRRHAE